MKITLVRPNMGVRKGQDYQDLGSMEPYALAILAGVVPKGIDIQVFDDRIDEIDYNQKTDLVAISVETFTAKRAYAIAQKYRERKIPVVLGGFHPSLVPDEAKQFADSVVVGEAEPIMGNILDDFKNGQLKPFYYPGFQNVLSGYKANRDIFIGKKYLPITLTHFSRGCPYSCSYCPDATLYGGRIRFRPVKDVIEDIETQTKKLIFFVDNNITYDKQRLKELLKAITPLKINWISQADINVAQDEELLDLMVKSGCFGLVVGFETLSGGNLQQMNKVPNIPLLSHYDELVGRIHGHGISIWAAFLLGYDHDTKDTIKLTVDFAIKHKYFFAAFNHLIPYYGTPIYNNLKKENRLLFDKWWLDNDFKFGQVAFKPRNMSAQELSEECLKAREAFNSYTNIISRATNMSANLRSLQKAVLFFKYTYLFKKEIKNKQDIILK